MVRTGPTKVARGEQASDGIPQVPINLVTNVAHLGEGEGTGEMQAEFKTGTLFHLPQQIMKPFKGLKRETGLYLRVTAETVKDDVFTGLGGCQVFEEGGKGSLPNAGTNAHQQTVLPPGLSGGSPGAIQAQAERGKSRLLWGWDNGRWIQLDPKGRDQGPGPVTGRANVQAQVGLMGSRGDGKGMPLQPTNLRAA